MRINRVRVAASVPIEAVCSQPRNVVMMDSLVVIVSLSREMRRMVRAQNPAFAVGEIGLS